MRHIPRKPIFTICFLLVGNTAVAAEPRPVVSGGLTASGGYTDNVFEQEHNGKGARYFNIESSTSGVLALEGVVLVVNTTEDATRHENFSEADGDSGRITVGAQHVIKAFEPLAGWKLTAGYTRALSFEPTFEFVRGKVHIFSAGLGNVWNVPGPLGGTLGFAIGASRAEVDASLADRYAIKSSLEYLKPLPGDITLGISPTLAWTYYDILNPTRTDWRWGVTASLAKAFAIKQNLLGTSIEEVVIGIEASILRNESSTDFQSFTRFDAVPKFNVSYKF